MVCLPRIDPEHCFVQADADGGGADIEVFSPEGQEVVGLFGVCYPVFDSSEVEGVQVVGGHLPPGSVLPQQARMSFPISIL
jgi:hypothetical protein